MANLVGAIHQLGGKVVLEEPKKGTLNLDAPRRRSYYRLTDLGRRALCMEAERLASQVQIANMDTHFAVKKCAHSDVKG